MALVIVLAVLAYWLLGDEPQQAARPAPAPAAAPPSPAGESPFTIGGTAAPIGNPVQLGGGISVEACQRARRLVPPPPSIGPSCGGGGGPP